MSQRNEIINFLYCFDKNYNKQAFSSIISLLDNISKKINIYIIHQEKNFVESIPDKINFHEKLNELKVYEFKDRNHNFPNLGNNHVSEATYYRLFIENYLDKDIEVLIYLDADTICLRDPIESLEKSQKELIESSYIFAARTELKKSEIDNYEKFYIYSEVLPFERLGVENLYFNAGVLIIDYKKWTKEKLGSKLLKQMKDLENKIVTWDQDVLNSLINGNYLELAKEFNFFDSEYKEKDKKEKPIIIHFLGSNKPWKTSGAFMKAAKYYHYNFSKIHNKKYHIEHSWKSRSVKDLLKAIINFKFFNVSRPFSYIKEFILSLFKSS